MSDGRDDEPDEHQQDDGEWEEERPRTLFSTLWFRALLILVVLGAVAAVAMPYLTDTPGTTEQVAHAPESSAPAAQSEATAPVPAPASGASPPAASPAPTGAATTATLSPSAPAKPPAPGGTPKDAVARREPAKTGAVTAVTRTDDTRKADPPATRMTKTAGGSAAKATRPETKPARTAPGEWFVQVGAFRDRATADRTANALKQRGYTVEQSTTRARSGTGAGRGAPTATSAATTAEGVDRYDVIVTGAAATEITQRVSSRGLAVESVRDGAVVTPSLALRDAVALSNDLRSEGYKVNVRRVARRGAATPAPAAAALAADEKLHRVRVGTFTDRAAATEAADRLRQLGYGVYIARGHE